MSLKIGDIVYAYIGYKGDLEWHYGFLFDYQDYPSGSCWAFYPFIHPTGLGWMLPIEQYGKSWFKLPYEQS